MLFHTVTVSMNKSVSAIPTSHGVITMLRKTIESHYHIC